MATGSTIFALIEQMCATDTNIGIAVNPSIVYNVLFWYGMLDGVPSMAPVTKNLERIIDAFQKTGERLNWLTDMLDNFKNDLPRMARFTADRMSGYTQGKRREAGNPIAIVDAEFDVAVADMHAEKDGLDAGILRRGLQKPSQLRRSAVRIRPGVPARCRKPASAALEMMAAYREASRPSRPRLSIPWPAFPNSTELGAGREGTRCRRAGFEGRLQGRVRHSSGSPCSPAYC